MLRATIASLLTLPILLLSTPALATDCTSLPDYDNGCSGPYCNWTYGDQVVHNGNAYQCRPWPHGGWCAQTVYEPGTPVGGNAWIDHGVCDGRPDESVCHPPTPAPLGEVLVGTKTTTPVFETAFGVKKWDASIERGYFDDYSYVLEGFDSGGNVRVRVRGFTIDVGGEPFQNFWNFEAINFQGVTATGVLEIDPANGNVITNTVPQVFSTHEIIFKDALNLDPSDPDRPYSNWYVCAGAILGGIAAGVGCAGCSIATAGVCAIGCAAAGGSVGVALVCGCLGCFEDPGH